MFSDKENNETGVKYVVPRWWGRPKDYVNYQGTTMIFPLDKPGYDYNEMKSILLKNVEAATMLFLSKLNELHIQNDSGDNITYIKDEQPTEDEKTRLVTLTENNKKDGTQYLVRKEIFDRPKDIIQENREMIMSREVIIAHPVKEFQNLEIQSQVFAYLPTNYKPNFPFLINADFILNADREIKGTDLLEDCPKWNKWTWECISKCAANSLPLLAKRGILTINRLNALAKPLNDLSSFDVCYSMREECRSSFLNNELLPLQNGLCTAREAMLVGSSELLDLLDNSEINGKLFGRKYWLNKEITRSNQQYSPLYNFLHNEDILGIPDKDFSEFLRKLDDSFLKEQNDEWIKKFYKHLSKRTFNEKSKAKEKPIIRIIDSGKEKMVTPSSGGKPKAYITNDPSIVTSLPVVKPELYMNDGDIRSFLKDDMHIPEINDIARIKTEILPKYEADPVIITKEEHFKHIALIAKTYKSISRQDLDDLQTSLKGTPFILTINYKGETKGYKKPSDIYIGSDELKSYFTKNDTISFISPDYDATILKMFIELGVSDKIKVTRKQKDYSGYVTIVNENSNHKRGLNNFDPDIKVDGIKFALKTVEVENNSELAEYIWNNIAVSYSECILGTVETSSRADFNPCQKETTISPHFGRPLRDFSWLPNKDGRFKKPSELMLSELPDSFTRDEKLAGKLRMKQDTIAKLGTELGVPPEDIFYLKENLVDFKKWKEDRERRQTPDPFPDDDVSIDPEARKKRLTELEAIERKRIRVMKETTVTYTEDEKASAKAYLLNYYRDANEKMRCQICGEDIIEYGESPFKTRNDEWHFEAYPFLPSLRKKLYRENFLALCHNHAAMFRLIDEKELLRIEKTILNRNSGDERVITVQIPEKDNEKKIWFRPVHLNDLQALLEKEHQRGEN